MLEFYILQSKPNSKEIYMWNIFNNGYIRNECIRARNKYKRAPSKYKRYMWGGNGYIYGYEAFKTEIKSILMHEMWARCEYEFYAQDMFLRDNEKDKYYKIDGWFQCEPNLELICQMILKSKEKINDR